MISTIPVIRSPSRSSKTGATSTGSLRHVTPRVLVPDATLGLEKRLFIIIYGGDICEFVLRNVLIAEESHDGHAHGRFLRRICPAICSDVRDAPGQGIAVLNSFGAAGSNGALDLEEYTTEALPGTFDDSPPALTRSYPIVFGFSAETPEAVEELHLLRSISKLTTPSFRDLAYTSTARRQLYPHRVSITADCLDSLTTSLESAVPTQVVPVEKVAFVFSGQGVQHLGMGGRLHWTNEVFRSHVYECQRILEGFSIGSSFSKKTARQVGSRWQADR